MNNMSMNNGLTQVDSLVFYIAKLHGIKDLKIEDRKFAVIWLQKNLQGLGITEVAKAADMALNGQIEVSTHLYGNVSPKYLAELLKKYRIWKQESDKQKMLKAPLLPQPKTPQAEKDKIIKQELFEVFEQFRKEKSLPFCASYILFDYAWKNGMTRYDKTVINTIKDRATRQLEMDADTEKAKAKDVFEMRQIINKYQDINDKTIFKNRCKELYLIHFFTDLVEMQEDIKNFIK